MLRKKVTPVFCRAPAHKKIGSFLKIKLVGKYLQRYSKLISMTAFDGKQKIPANNYMIFVSFKNFSSLALDYIA